MKENVIVDKSRSFAIRIINLYKYLCDAKKEFVISKQLLRSGTSIGANVKESVYASSKLDFVNKLRISLKEASESEYWIDLLFATCYIDKEEFDSLDKDCKEIIKILTAIVNSTKFKK